MLTPEMNAAMRGQQPFIVPRGIEFKDLALGKEGDQFALNWLVILAICAASSIEERVVREGPPVILPMLLIGWLDLLVAAGEVRDEDVQDERDILAQMCIIANEVMKGVAPGDVSICVCLERPVLH